MSGIPQSNREEEVNLLLSSFTQDFVKQFEKQLINYYQEVMGELKKSSGASEVVVQGVGTALEALGGYFAGCPALGARVGRIAGEKAGEYAPQLGRQLEERTRVPGLGWAGKWLVGKVREYAPGLGENLGRYVGDGIQRKACSYIKDYLSGKEHKNKAERMIEITAPLLLNNKPEFRKMLVDAAIEVFRSFESQIVRISVDSGSMMVVRKNFAADTVERVINYVDKQMQNDPKTNISLDLITKGAIFGKSEGNVLAAFKFSQIESNRMGSSTWTTSELYENTGVARDEVWYKKRSNTDECGHRLLLDWEEKEWGSKLRYHYDAEEDCPTRIYNYVLKAEDFIQKSIDILKEIYDKDPVSQLERKDLVDAAEEGARRALDIQQLSRSSCYVMIDPVWSFTGREKELNTIHETFQVKAEECTLLSRMIVISGLGGMGKSELARKYAHKYRHDYDGNVLWINAEEFKDIEGSFKRLAKEELKIPVEDKGKERDIESIVRDVYKHFSKCKSIFIFDNVEKYKSEMAEVVGQSEPSEGWNFMHPFFGFLFGEGVDEKKQDAGIDRFLPMWLSPDARPYFLITSRNREWVSGVTVIELEGLETNDAISFVKTALSVSEGDGSKDGKIDMLVKGVDNYPLALQQAVAYIRSEKRFEVSDYLKEYEQEAVRLYKCKAAGNYSETILTTWGVTINKIAEDRAYGKLALDIFNIMAYFPPDDIRRSIFLNLADGDTERLNSAVELLVKYSVVNSQQYHSILGIHRIVQLSTRIKLKEGKKEGDVLREGLGLFRNNIKTNNVNCVVGVWEYASNNSESLVKEFSNLPAEIISQLGKDGRYREACLFGIKAFELLKGILGSNHPDTLTTEDLMAAALADNGRYGEALETLQRVLQRREEIYGPDHPDTLKTRHSTAAVLLNQGNYSESLKICQSVFETRNEALGPEHPNTLNTRSNIAVLLSKQGNYSEALKTHRDVFEKRRDVLGPEHPDTLDSLHNIAGMLFYQGKYNEALKEYRAVLDIQQRIGLGPSHPNILLTRNNIAVILFNQGNYKEAFHTCMAVFEKRRDLLGPEHPDTLTTRLSIAKLLNGRGNHSEALKICQAILDIQQRTYVLGPRHPNTLLTRSNIAAVLFKQGNYSEALEIFRAVFEERKDILGPRHPSTLITRSNIAEMLSKQGNHSEALEIFRAVFEERKDILGPRHPSTLITRSNIADMLSKQGNHSEALEIFRSVFEERKDILGPDHPDTLIARNNIEIVERKQFCLAISNIELVERKRLCLIQFCQKQPEAYMHLSQFVSNNLANPCMVPVKQGLYLPSFEKRGIKITGKCVAITRGLSQALFLDSCKSFLGNLETSTEIYERIARGKQISGREEREVFGFSKLLSKFEIQLQSSTNSLPSNLIRTNVCKTLTLDELSYYIVGTEGDFAIHLVTCDHVVAIYRTGHVYAYFDSNTAFISGVKSVCHLMQAVEKAVGLAGYTVEERGFRIEHFDVNKANKLLSSTDKHILSKEIKSERQLLSEQDKELGIIKISAKELPRVQLYDFGTKVYVGGGVSLLINADMSLNSKKFQDHLDRREVSMTAREYFGKLKISKNLDIVKATRNIPFEGSEREIEEAEKWRNF